MFKITKTLPAYKVAASIEITTSIEFSISITILSPLINPALISYIARDSENRLRPCN